jgi:hypothetical protein
MSPRKQSGDDPARQPDVPAIPNPALTRQTARSHPNGCAESATTRAVWLQLHRLDPVALAVALSELVASHPDHPVAAAARLAVDVGDLRRAGSPLDDYAGGRFHREHVLDEYTAIQKCRWPPTGDRSAWIRWGPAGPPPTEAAHPALACTPTTKGRPAA